MKKHLIAEGYYSNMPSNFFVPKEDGSFDLEDEKGNIIEEDVTEEVEKAAEKHPEEFKKHSQEDGSIIADGSLF